MSLLEIGDIDGRVVQHADVQGVVGGLGYHATVAGDHCLHVIGVTVRQHGGRRGVHGGAQQDHRRQRQLFHEGPDKAQVYLSVADGPQGLHIWQGLPPPRQIRCDHAEACTGTGAHQMMVLGARGARHRQTQHRLSAASLLIVGLIAHDVGIAAYDLTHTSPTSCRHR